MLLKLNLLEDYLSGYFFDKSLEKDLRGIMEEKKSLTADISKELPESYSV